MSGVATGKPAFSRAGSLLQRLQNPWAYSGPGKRSTDVGRLSLELL